ncbi:MAG: hypothetical protein QM426_11695 [Euryarchaeota archaeon]|nr:hypothetical protein [Euryarchaeota archaeon]
MRQPADFNLFNCHRSYRKRNIQAAKYQRSGDWRTLFFRVRPSLIYQGNRTIIFVRRTSGHPNSYYGAQGIDQSFSGYVGFFENYLLDTDFRNFENIIMKASNALGTIMLEPKEKFLVSYTLATKLSVETFNGPEYIHEAESFE